MIKIQVVDNQQYTYFFIEQIRKIKKENDR
jgi:hypothetical protein